MFDYTIADVVRTLRMAKNLNSAVKHFLKHEIKPGDSAGKFAKELRDVVLSNNDLAIESFFKRYLPQYERHLLAIGGYAHWDFIGKLVEEIGESYADAFNQTYAVSESEFTMKNEKEFSCIAKQAVERVVAELKAREFGDSMFMKNIVLSSLFEPKVLERVQKVI